MIQTGDKSYQLLYTYHKLILDGWSNTLIWREILAFYNSFCKGHKLQLPLPRPYWDYLAWLQQQNLSAAEKYWKESLQDIDAMTCLSQDKISQYVWNEDDDFDTDRNRLHLTESITRELEFLAARNRLTLNTLVHGAWALLLSRYSGELNVIFGTTVSGRPRALTGTESMLGPFENILPFRVRISQNENLLSWLGNIQLQRLSLQSYEFAPPKLVQKWCNVPVRAHLFDSVLLSAISPARYSMKELNKAPVLKIAHYHAKHHYPVLLIVGKRDDKLALRIQHHPERVDGLVIANLLDCLKTLLENMASNLNQKVGDLAYR
jgi:hypothetical protein